MTAAQMDLFAPGLSHRDDPITSHEAGHKPDNVVRWGSQRYLLLEQFRTADLTDEEAGRRAGIGDYNERRRCSDLRRMGLIAPTAATRPTRTGSEAMVCTITDAGSRALMIGFAARDKEAR